MKTDRRKKVCSVLFCFLFVISVVSLCFSIEALRCSDSEPFLDPGSFVKSVAQLHSAFDTSASFSNASAFVVNDSGMMMTNFHAVSLEQSDGSYEVSDKVSVRFPDEKDYSDAIVVKYDKILDIALIKSSSAVSRKPFSLSSFEVSYGEKCFSIGNANNQGVAISSGIVSIPKINVTVNGESQVYIQANIDIFPGSSGGCLIDGKGAVIGMPSFRLKDSSNDVIYGYGYSIPSQRLSAILNGN